MPRSLRKKGISLGTSPSDEGILGTSYVLFLALKEVWDKSLIAGDISLFNCAIIGARCICASEEDLFKIVFLHPEGFLVGDTFTNTLGEMMDNLLGISEII